MVPKRDIITIPKDLEVKLTKMQRFGVKFFNMEDLEGI